MALANFFERTATAAAQVLQNFDLPAFKALLGNTVVGVAFDDAALSREGLAALELSVSLLARLYPKIGIIALAEAARPAGTRLAKQARGINPEVEITKRIGQVDVCLVVGETSVSGDLRPIYIGSEDWIARLSTEEPVGSGNSLNPFGAGVAACFGAANVFRTVFADQLPAGARDRDIALSLLDYAGGTTDAGPPIPEIDLEETHLIGLGAIGNGAVWALSRIEHLLGLIHLIDPESVELSNLQRYVVTVQKHDGAVKVAIAEKELKRKGLQIQSHACSWSDYLAKRDDFRLERVVVALDTAGDRIAVQASLPRWIVNAWTQENDLGVSRHDFLGEHACLACLYLPEGQRPSEDEIVAGAIRMPEALREVRDLLATGRPIGADFVNRLSERWGVPREELAGYEAAPLRVFYIKAVCGGGLLRLTNGIAQPATDVAVPMAFQSALAGIMLAAELVIHAGKIGRPAVATTSRINLLRPLGRYLSRPLLKHASGRCICQDPDYIEAHKAKYHAPTAETARTVRPATERKSSISRKGRPSRRTRDRDRGRDFDREM